jgi:hypothetical protein
MKKKVPRRIKYAADDIQPEYDFSGGVRGKYAKTLREDGYTVRVQHADGTFTETRVLGEKTVVLEPDVYEYFPDSDSVNRALRTLISIVPKKHEAVFKERSKIKYKLPVKKRRLAVK